MTVHRHVPCRPPRFHAGQRGNAQEGSARKPRRETSSVRRAPAAGRCPLVQRHLVSRVGHLVSVSAGKESKPIIEWPCGCKVAFQDGWEEVRLCEAHELEEDEGDGDDA